MEDTKYFETQIKLAENIVKLDDEDIKKTWYSKRPAKLLNFLYLGDCTDANSIGMLTEMGITHALNCAGSHRSFFSQFPQYCGNNNAITYKQFDADDFENYDITVHFPESIAYIDEVQEANGKVLVYCKMGMNRSATICIAYLIARKGMKFLDAVKAVQEKRIKILTNKGFLRQLARFANVHGLLWTNSLSSHISRILVIPHYLSIVIYLHKGPSCPWWTQLLIQSILSCQNREEKNTVVLCIYITNRLDCNTFGGKTNFLDYVSIEAYIINSMKILKYFWGQN